MTLDESIKHEEEIANDYEKNAKHIREKMESDIALSNADNLDKYAKNHRQIAEWLKDYKRFLEQEPVLDKIRAEIEQRSFGIANDSVIQGMIYEREDILKIIDKYRKEQMNDIYKQETQNKA